MAVSHRARATASRLARGLPLLAIASSLSCVAMPLEQREWWGIETPRFEIMTSLGRGASVQLASDLEHFIEASEAILGTSSNRPAARIRVYAHDGKSLERPFAVANQPSYFLASKAGGTLVLRAGSGFDDATESTRFDLVRHLARNSGGSRTPRRGSRMNSVEQGAGRRSTRSEAIRRIWMRIK